MFFAPETHGFFDDLVTMLVSISSYMFTMHVSMASNNPVPFGERPLEEWIGYIAPIKAPAFSFTIDRRFDEQSLVVFPANLIMPVSLRGWPQFIEYELIPTPRNTSPDHRLAGVGNTRIMSGIVGNAFANYYSYCEPFLKGNRHATNEIVRFARTIRNGFAHGGRITIREQSSRSVSWRKWRLSHKDNGRQCLFEQGMLGVGDVIALMEELDELVRFG